MIDKKKRIMDINNNNLSTSIGISSLMKDKSSSITTNDCSYYGRVNTTGFGFIRSYEGIPENLLVNLVVSAVCNIIDKK